MRAFIVACLVVAAVAAPFDLALNGEWEAFKGTYNKKFISAEEEGLRRMVWEDNLDYVQSHNLEADRGMHTFWLGMNEYADMGIEEFKAIMNGFNTSSSVSKCGNYMAPNNIEISDLPDMVDWRKDGYVTPIKNQGQCGSCWSFSATGSLEGQHFRKTQNLVSLSEKNLMDCSAAYGNHGCQGGLMDQAFAYVISNKGIDTEMSYPYEPKNGPCKFEQSNVGATEVSCMDIEHESESNLQKAVAMEGPISVAIDAGHRSFQLYKRGVYKEPECSSVRLDHGVLAVGYGTDGSSDYWLVKNSWGESWGNMGYVEMARNDKNMCGIATQASFPTV
ncbi:procathepsin L-like [Mya arenaria]|uniref:procathepsin L-like n=1 Tax=Mya arenaria TaxID=6604 RepID=UPI0022E67AD2|nr:procathepsin L-like [Mya arenaria]